MNGGKFLLYYHIDCLQDERVHIRVHFPTLPADAPSSETKHIHRDSTLMPWTRGDIKFVILNDLGVLRILSANLIFKQKNNLGFSFKLDDWKQVLADRGGNLILYIYMAALIHKHFEPIMPGTHCTPRQAALHMHLLFILEVSLKCPSCVMQWNKTDWYKVLSC